MSTAQNQMNFSKALKLVKEDFSLTNVRALVIASSVVLRQGIALTNEHIDELISAETEPKVVKENVIYHENLSIARYYKIVYQDSDYSVLKNLDSKEVIVVKADQMSKYKPSVMPK